MKVASATFLKKELQLEVLESGNVALRRLKNFNSQENEHWNAAQSKLARSTSQSSSQPAITSCLFCLSEA